MKVETRVYKAQHQWPPYSPDLTCLEFSFWSQAQDEVVRRKPQTLSQLMDVVENFARRTICGGWHATLGAEPSCAARNIVGILSICSEHKMNRMEMCFAWHQMSNIYLCKRMSLYYSVCEYTPVTIPYFMSFTNEHPVIPVVT